MIVPTSWKHSHRYARTARIFQHPSSSYLRKKIMYSSVTMLEDESTGAKGFLVVENFTNGPAGFGG
jgi:hypothetical protein